jgi:hypothetical protein
MISSLGQVADPSHIISMHRDGLVHLSFIHQPDYSEEPGPMHLHVLFERKGLEASICISAEAFDVDQLQASGTNLATIAKAHQLSCLRLDTPWPLEVVKVPKPWGAEIWYTGIEARGVCTSAGIPLPWLLACLPKTMVGSASGSAPLLLKILDPLPNPDLGNLYFELHDKKIEVYIVTHVDRVVWPDGVGKIRYGFDQACRAAYKNDTAFKAAYLKSVQTYEQCRADIDTLLDQARQKAGLGGNDPVAPETMERWLQALPPEMTEQERQLRNEMEAFTHLRSIKAGDVIRVEPFFPHSLQHGVRVIEFQTASYERFILSFGQKVLTQSHWDTEAALDQAILDMPPEEDFTLLPGLPGANLEVIADFSAFRAIRMTIAARSTVALPESDDYRLLICASGDLTLSGGALNAEDAVLIPAAAGANSDMAALTLTSNTGCVCILAEPKAT